jgi:saccharopine dehydrogenase-like NADP-dependent oxidoreductase
MKSAVILGSGRVGSAMVMDLSIQGEFEITAVDSSAAALARVAERFGANTVEADLSDVASVGRLVGDHDIVLGALPSVLGLQTMRAVIGAGKHYVDISRMAEDPRELSALARDKGVIAVADCGAAPGVSNMMAGYAASRLDPCERIVIHAGGLPVERRWPYDFKAAFTPYDIIEEYVRPARMVEHGEVVVREALSEPELIDFPAVGTLEAFNTDGLRTLLTSLSVPFMREKTLRYPGHAQLMRALRETGMFSKEEVEVGGALVRPLDMTAALLFPRWTYDEGEPDLIVLRVVANGTRDGNPVTYRWHLHDVYDAATDTRSMSRVAAFPAAITARVIAEGRFPLGPGVYAPEDPAPQPGFLDEMLNELEQRGVHCICTVFETAEG